MALVFATAQPVVSHAADTQAALAGNWRLLRTANPQGGLEQFVRILLKGKDWNWLGRMTPAQLREATASMLSAITDLPPGATVDTVLAMAGKDEPFAPVLDAKAKLEIPKPKRKRSSQTKARAGALLREQLKHGPKPESTVMAAAHLADIPKRTLIAAADALGVRTQRGQWWIPS